MTTLEFYDTHCNIPCILDQLHLKGYNDYESIVRDTAGKYGKETRLKGCISVASDKESHLPTKQMEPYVHTVYGIHPLYCNSVDASVYDDIERFIQSDRCVALGETGLDYHNFPGMNYAGPEQQKLAFKRQLDIAKRYNKALVIHTREAEDDTMQMLKDNVSRDTFMDVHCYTGSVEMAQWIINEYPNSYIGIAGVVTFKNGDNIRRVVEAVPLDRLLVETDGPFMAPVPFRGKTSHSGMIPWILDTIAKVKGLSVDDVCAQTTKNAEMMFSIGQA